MADDKLAVRASNLLAPSSIDEAVKIGGLLAQSGFFADTRQAAQAVTKVIAGAELGIGPFRAMSEIHVIQGKLSIGASIIASKVKGSGKYDYDVLEHSETACVIDFFEYRG